MGEIIKIDNEKNNEIMQMNHQFIQSVLFDWDKISDESYLTRIEALYKVKKIDFMKPITLFVGENGSGKSTLLQCYNDCKRVQERKMGLFFKSGKFL